MKHMITLRDEHKLLQIALDCGVRFATVRTVYHAIYRDQYLDANDTNQRIANEICAALRLPAIKVYELGHDLDAALGYLRARVGDKPFRLCDTGLSVGPARRMVSALHAAGRVQYATDHWWRLVT